MSRVARTQGSARCAPNADEILAAHGDEDNRCTHHFPLRQQIWTDADILFFHLFLLKLDMLFTCPVLGNGICELSHMLLTQKFLTTLFEVLAGKKVIYYDEASDMLVRAHLQEDPDTDTHSWQNNEIENRVPEDRGIPCPEGWDMDRPRMESAIDMVIMEKVKRELHPEALLLDFLLYGFLDPDEVKNVPYARRWRGEKKVRVSEGGVASGESEEVGDWEEDQF